MQTTTTLFTKERAEYLAAQNTSTDGDWIYKAVPVTGSAASHYQVLIYDEDNVEIGAL